MSSLPVSPTRPLLFRKIPGFSVALFLLAAALLFMPGRAARAADAGEDVESLQGMVKEWTELRRVIAEQRAEWKVEKVFLEENLDLVGRQIEVVRQKLEETEGVGDETAAEIDKLEALKSELSVASNTLAERIEGLEAAVKALVKRFPPPLVDTVQPLLRRIPEDPAASDLPLGQRLQNVVGIISLAEKFNSSLIYKGEVRDLGGAEKQVWTLYWGLAASFSADAEGTGALVGYPGEGGWVFEERPEMTATIVRLMQTYEGSRDPEFVETPATIR
jgi:hypothetical protein